MPSNFIILYNGREGSSAIVNSLSGQSGISVPLMEELDAYIYTEKFKARDLPETLDKIFTTGIYDHASMTETHLQKPQPRHTEQAVGFKWRLFGDLEKIAAILVKHNVTVYSLFRKNFIDITCSAYAHAYGNKLQTDVDMMPFPQFQTFDVSEAKRDAYFKSLSEQHFKLVRRWLLLAAYRQIKRRREQKQTLIRLNKSGVTMKTIYYEDFNHDPDGFIKNMMRDICGPENQNFSPACDFKKVHSRPLSDRIIGLEGHISGPLGLPYRLMRAKYDATLQEIAALSS